MFHLFQSPSVDPLSDLIELFEQPGIGQVTESISPATSGRVYYRTTYWDAIVYDPAALATLPCETHVRVLGRKGIVLLVMPISV